MNQQFAINAPLNNLSFGSVSIAILRELYNRGLAPSIFPIGPIDISAQKKDDGFEKWLNACIGKAQKTHNRNDPCIKLWHINGSLETPSKTSNLITFLETDSPTDSEINILRNHEKVYVTNNYIKDILTNVGLDNVAYLPLGFDSHNFHQLEKRPKINGVTSWVCVGKLEFRKATLRQIRLWAAKYGNKKEHRLNAAIINPFLKPEDQNAMISRALGGKHYLNINFLPFAPTNEEYNTTLQSGDIVLTCSLSEGRGLGEYHSTAMGAWPVALNAHAYKDYLNNENAVLVEPCGKIDSTDGIFFKGAESGSEFNIGSFFDFKDEAFYAGCEEAERRVKTIGLNTAGYKLQEQTCKETVDVLLAGLK